MKEQHHELLDLLINYGTPVSESILCSNIWFLFGNEGEELPYFYFHHDGQGLFRTPDSETEIFWEMSEVGNIRIEFDGVKTPWKGLTYKEVFMALISDITDDALLLFNSEGLKEQWQAFSN
ncbi:hypothetical protein [Algoriphagus boritolerans]|uniref:Uncharacterized protein n=2 Tax=Algoriphagus TaxID=246875 RepID=A0A1H5YSE5_9BACT|nr:hypothetical protein [Algoriphagus boritolerans]SEG26417.1 hypothetical protein SAMN03080598_03123 [Algoriphagus boritolerans DSM 17298 = JCM 18970]